MKLLFCPSCLDIRKLKTCERTKCKCGHSWGQYAQDGWHSVYGGKGKIIALATPDIQQALRQPEYNVLRCWMMQENAPQCFHESKVTNKRQCLKCGETIYSLYRHDFVKCKCGAIAIDGGFDYCRIIGDIRSVKNVKRKKKN